MNATTDQPFWWNSTSNGNLSITPNYTEAPQSSELPGREEGGDLLDETTSFYIETAINAGLLPVIVSVGISTNIINTVVFYRQGLRDRINLCLFSLAVADAGYLLALFAYKFFSILSLVSRELGNFWKIRSLNTVIGVFWGFSSTSNLHTMIIALDRCFCVVSPFRAKHVLKTKVTAITILIIYICIMGSSGIFNVKFDVGSRVDSETNSTIYTAVLSEFYIEHKVFVDLVYNFILAICIPFTSLVVVIVSTAITVVKLRMALAWKQESQSVMAADLKEEAVTKMLLVVCYVYVICVTPSVLNAFMVQFIDEWLPTGRYSNTFYVYVALMHLLTATNSSVNFFIYYSRGTKFRNTIKDICTYGRKREAETENVTQFSSM